MPEIKVNEAAAAQGSKGFYDAASAFDGGADVAENVGASLDGALKGSAASNLKATLEVVIGVLLSLSANANDLGELILDAKQTFSEADNNAANAM